MTVREAREFLANLPDDMPLLKVWNCSGYASMTLRLGEACFVGDRRGGHWCNAGLVIFGGDVWPVVVVERDKRYAD